MPHRHDEKIHGDAALSSPFEGDKLLRSGLKFAHLKMIVALDDSEQVSAAASVLNISQPAASRMIAEIEALLGVAICERLPRGVELTAYGRAFARRARSILLEVREADREIRDLKTGRGGSVFLGAVTAPAIDLAVPAINRVRARYPRIDVNIQVDTSIVLARELLASRHDFIIARIPDDLNPQLFDARVIGLEHACLIVRRGHPLMQSGTLRLAELNGYEWVLQPSGSLLRRTIEGLFLMQGVALPERILNTTSLLLTMVMVAQTDSIAPVAREVAQFLVGADGMAGAVSILPTDFEIVVQPYSLIMARNRQLSPAAKLLYDTILDVTA
ncbi:LysR substrate-binding domain-containing protein [Methylobrevis albus]|uniref:LysR family transcriptional regulator n=1 Tax=Methylobrevis albus TaxID=2793297 RepID=A0A931MXU0_9HYPH|nr:LysR substrate-binding domain-containing protein [Methylobrevis albus]MBH0239618.1 LysR family transcriptional regulator [Methylobrevis albus]